MIWAIKNDKKYWRSYYSLYTSRAGIMGKTIQWKWYLKQLDTLIIVSPIISLYIYTHLFKVSQIWTFINIKIIILPFCYFRLPRDYTSLSVFSTENGNDEQDLRKPTGNRDVKYKPLSLTGNLDFTRPAISQKAITHIGVKFGLKCSNRNEFTDRLPWVFKVWLSSIWIYRTNFKSLVT